MLIGIGDKFMEKFIKLIIKREAYSTYWYNKP